MELLVYGFFVFLFVALAWDIHRQRVRREKEVKAAYDFTPANALGGARFANNDDLRKAGLL